MDPQPSPLAHRRLAHLARQRFVDGLCASLPALDKKIQDFLTELMGQGTDVGRRLDFAVQECFREITTCGNKVQDAQVQRLVVDFKNELEKCREQVQNLE